MDGKKKKRYVRMGLLLPLMLLVAASFVAAQMASPNFRIPTSVLDNGGGQAGSAVFKIRDSIGQSTAIGVSQSPNFGLYAGFQPTTLEEFPSWVPEIRLSAEVLDWGEVWVGDSSDQVLSIYNDGLATLEVSDISSDGPQFLASPQVLSVGGLGSAGVVITFVPTVEDTVEGVLTVVCNDPDEGVLYVNLRGVGIAGCPGELGDVNGDGAVNVLDLVTAVNEILNPGSLDECERWRADCNQDDKVNVLDLVGMVNVILETGTCPPGRTAKAVVTTARVWSPSESMERGAKSAELPIFVDSQIEIAGVQLRLSYDAEVLTPGTSLLTKRTRGMTVASHARDGELTIVVYSAEGQAIPPGNGAIVIVSFKVPDFGHRTLDFGLQFEEVILAASCTEVIPVEIEPITLKLTAPVPTEFALEQNYPNPFNPTTDIRYQIPALVSDLSSFISLKIYNLLGQEVRTLVDEVQEAGYYTVTWDGRNEKGDEVSSGIYFYRLTAGETSRHSRGGFTAAKRMVLLR